MKKTTKVVLSSAMTMAMCASLIAGSTLALFSSKSDVNIAITSGKVDVVATVMGDTLKTYSMGTEQATGQFETGGTAVLEGNSLTLDRIAPGDKVEFTVHAENKSTIKVKYRLKLECETCDYLMAGMLITVSGTPYENIVRFTGAWQEMEEAATVDIPLSFELPSTAGNEYQELEGKIVFSVEAVQSNGVGMTEDEVLHYTRLEVEGTTPEEKFESFTAALDEVKKAGGGKVELTDDLEIKGASEEDPSNVLFGGIELDLGGNTLTLTSEKGNDVFLVNEADPEKEIIIENGTIDYTRNQYDLGDGALTINTKSYQKVTLKNITMNVKTHSTKINEQKAIEIHKNAELTLEGCTINGDIEVSGGMEVTATLNIFDSTINGTIVCSSFPTVVNMVGGTYTPREFSDAGLSRFYGKASFTGTHITKDLFVSPASSELTLDNCTLDGSIVSYIQSGLASEAKETEAVQNQLARLNTVVTVRNTTFTNAVKSISLASGTQYQNLPFTNKKTVAFDHHTFLKSISYIGCTFEEGVDLTYLDVSCAEGGFVLFDGCKITGNLNAKLRTMSGKNPVKTQLKNTTYGSVTGEQDVDFEIV